MRRSAFSVVLIVFLLFIGFTSVSSAASSAKAKTADVIRELRSVTCEGERLEDCKSAQSAQLRDYVAKRVEEGWSKKKILDQVVSIYGTEILLAPPKSGFALLLWVLPFVILIAAGVLIARKAGSWTADRNEESGQNKQTSRDDDYDARVEAELKTYEY